MDKLDAITLLYLSKHWDGQGSVLDCARVFQQTRDQLAKELGTDGLNAALDRGNYEM